MNLGTRIEGQYININYTLYTSTNTKKKNFKNNIYNSNNKIKYLGINVMKDTQDLDFLNYETFLRKIKI